MLLTTSIAQTLPLLLSAAASVIAAPGAQQHPLTKVVTNNHEPIDLSRWTIGQILNYTLHHADDPNRRTPPLKKLAKVANFSDSIIEYLSKEDISVTLFAPDDEALKDLPDHHHHDHEHEHAQGQHPFHAMLKAAEQDADDGDDDGGKHKEPTREEKRRFIKKIVSAVLKYHVVPEKLEAGELLDMQTVPTALNQTRKYGTPFRIRLRPKLDLLPPPPSYDLTLNFYAKARNGPSLIAKNGIIHLISAPLLPPLPPLDQLFLFPLTFSALTSTLQQVELDHVIAPYYHHHHESHGDDFEGLQNMDNGGILSRIAGLEDEQTHPAVTSALEELINEALEKAGMSTLRQDMDEEDRKKEFAAWPFTVFAPTNLAFAKIPFKIRLFLLGPFGHRVLKKVLSYHIIPQTILHTDYYLNASRSVDVVDFGAVSSGVKNMVEALPKWFQHDDEHDDFSGVGFPMPHPPHRGPPSPPGRPGRPGPGKDKPHGPEGHVHKFELPTLLGSEKNESLSVHVYEYRLGFGKGPKTRAIAVGNPYQDEHEYVKAVISDGVAWGGAVHVVNSLIRPPFAHRGHDGHEHHGEHGRHEHDHHHDHEGHHDKHEQKGDAERAALSYFRGLWA